MTFSDDIEEKSKLKQYHNIYPRRKIVNCWAPPMDVGLQQVRRKRLKLAQFWRPVSHCQDGRINDPILRDGRLGKAICKHVGNRPATPAQPIPSHPNQNPTDSTQSNPNWTLNGKMKPKLTFGLCGFKSSVSCKVFSLSLRKF